MEFKNPNPGIAFTWIINLLIKALGALLPILTPIIKRELEEFLTALYKKAVETPNPWDDFVVRFLLRILSIPVPED
jgi:hypothetical protein